MTRRPDPSHTSPDRPAGPTRHDESGVVAPSRVMLVAIVLVAVAAATYVAGLGSGPSEADVASPAAARQAPSSAASDPTESSTPSPSTSPSASATASPSAKATAKKPQKSAAAKPKASQSAAPQAPQVQRGQVSVSVFNNSSRTGLAARTSTKVKDAGWKVIGTDNWYGSIPEPTVYYPARLKAAAQQLADDAGIDRVKPAVSPMRSDRLTLIVTGDYRL